MFAKERDWALSYGSQIKDASEKFSAVANARLRLIQQLGHLAGALSITVAGKIIDIITKNIIIINTVNPFITVVNAIKINHNAMVSKGAFSSYLHVSSGNEGANGVYNKLTNGFSGCIETIKVKKTNHVKSCLRSQTSSECQNGTRSSNISPIMF